MRFKKVYIEITNTCNLQCPFCIQNQRPAAKMSQAQFAHIIQELKPYTKYVYLHVLGEPLMHPELPQFLDICDKEGMLVNITTNGTLLEKRIAEIKSYPLRQMNISLHSYAVHRQSEYIKKAAACAKQLPNTYISYRLWCLKKGRMDEENQAMMHELADCYGKCIDSNLIQPGMSVKLKDRVFLSFEEVFTWPSLTHPFVSSKGTCRGFLDMCAILSDGSVVPCCLDSNGDLSYGNIYETSFQKIIEQSRTQHFCKELRNHNVIETLCQHCSYRLRFQKE